MREFFIFCFPYSFCIHHSEASGWKDTWSTMHDLGVMWSIIPCLSSALHLLKLFILITSWNFRWMQQLLLLENYMRKTEALM